MFLSNQAHSMIPCRLQLRTIVHPGYIMNACKSRAYICQIIELVSRAQGESISSPNPFHHQICSPRTSINYRRTCLYDSAHLPGRTWISRLNLCKSEQRMQSGTETSLDELVLCKYCHGINLENLTAEDGYLHAPSRSSLVRSAQKCRLCSLLFRKDRSRHSSQLRLKLEAFSDDDPQICLRVTHLNKKALVGHRLSFFLYTLPGM
jgi:hypothetical protein